LRSRVAMEDGLWHRLVRLLSFSGRPEPSLNRPDPGLDRPPLQDRYLCAACVLYEEYGVATCSLAELPAGCDYTQCLAAQCDWMESCSTECPLVMAATKATTALSVAKAVVPRVASHLAGSPVQLRVSKGFGTKPYGTLRVSAITAAADPAPFACPPEAPCYSQPFVYRWTDFALHSTVLAVEPGVATALDLSGGVTAQLSLPAQGQGSAGILIADPCVTGSQVGCPYQRQFQTDTRTTALLNIFAADDEIAYWGILGDNFYDQDGSVTARVFSQLSLTTLSKPLLSMPGNHDCWVLGNPLLGTRKDQYGNGFMQWYGQDTAAARGQLAGESTSEAPYDFSVSPDEGYVRGAVLGGNLVEPSNTFFYNQIGNVAFIGYAGVYDLATLEGQMTEACAWLPTQPGIELAVMLGHWDKGGDGATDATAVPGLYDRARSFPGCSELDEQGKLKMFMGHTHCNEVAPHGNIDTGFMVAGMGMGGCGNYGVPILDTTGGFVRVWYFPIVEAPPFVHPVNASDSFNEVSRCVTRNGWRQCTHLAQLWLEQPL